MHIFKREPENMEWRFFFRTACVCISVNGSRKICILSRREKNYDTTTLWGEGGPSVGKGAERQWCGEYVSKAEGGGVF